MVPRIMNLALLLGGTLLAAAMLLRWAEPYMIYFPSREVERTPAAIGLAFEEVAPSTEDGLQLHGWFVTARVKSSPTALILHGNAGNISHRLAKLAILHELGMNVLLIDYRGYGRSEGKPDEQGLYFDARAAHAYLTQARGIPECNIILYGESLGSAIAVDLAAQSELGGVILEAPFTSMADVGRDVYPFLPVGLLARSKYNSLSKIGRVSSPLLLLHSRDDELIPIRHSERLLAAAPGPKRLVELAGRHNDAFLASETAYRAGLRDFICALNTKENACPGSKHSRSM